MKQALMDLYLKFRFVNIVVRPTSYIDGLVCECDIFGYDEQPIGAWAYGWFAPVGAYRGRLYPWQEQKEAVTFEQVLDSVFYC
jgi:hypothetical protein